MECLNVIELLQIILEFALLERKGYLAIVFIGTLLELAKLLLIFIIILLRFKFKVIQISIILLFLVFSELEILMW